MSEVEITDRSRETSATIIATSSKKIEEFMQRFVEVAKMEAPYITGQLRRSINAGKSGDMEHTIFTQTGYGGFVHEGTSRQGANPFFNRAFARIKPEFERSGPWIK